MYRITIHSLFLVNQWNVSVCLWHACECSLCFKDFMLHWRHWIKDLMDFLTKNLFAPTPYCNLSSFLLSKTASPATFSWSAWFNHSRASPLMFWSHLYAWLHCLAGKQIFQEVAAFLRTASGVFFSLRIFLYFAAFIYVYKPSKSFCREASTQRFWSVS